MNFETIKERYLKFYIRDDQLTRFLDLNIVTQEQYDALWALKHPVSEV